MNNRTFSLFGDWRHLVEGPVLVGDVRRLVEKGSVPAFGFFHYAGGFWCHCNIWFVVQ